MKNLIILSFSGDDSRAVVTLWPLHGLSMVENGMTGTSQPTSVIEQDRPSGEDLSRFC